MVRSLFSIAGPASAASFVHYDSFPGSFLGPFDLSKAAYRFNWDSPIAFAPWDGHVAGLAGTSFFSRPIAAKRGGDQPGSYGNITEHQLPSGGPLAKDVSGAEYSDTILYIEGSSIDQGEIWVGTDDGYVQLTRDGGSHWQNVTPPERRQFARFRNGRAVAAWLPERRMPLRITIAVGDYAPYVYVTQITARTGRKSSTAAGRSVRAHDPSRYSQPYLLYAGTENGLWISLRQRRSLARFPNQSARRLGARPSGSNPNSTTWSLRRTDATHDSRRPRLRAAARQRTAAPEPCSSHADGPTSITTIPTIPESTHSSPETIRQRVRLSIFIRQRRRKKRLRCKFSMRRETSFGP